MGYEAFCSDRVNIGNDGSLDIVEPYLFDMEISMISNWIQYNDRWKFEDFIKYNAIDVLTENDSNAVFTIYVHNKETMLELKNIISHPSCEFKENLKIILNSTANKFYFMMC